MTSTRSGSDRRARIGLLGGTFNPIHLGHLRAAEEVLGALHLERVLFIPSAIPPHKKQDPNDPIASAADRLEWVERAIEGHPRFHVDRIEIDRTGASYLVDTLRLVRERESGKGKTVFIVGEDAFAEMGEWRSPEEIFAGTDLAVMTRPPGLLEELADRIPDVVRDRYDFESGGRFARHVETGATIELVTISALDISSSKIRSLCRTGDSIRYLVPESIRDSIVESGRFAADTEPNPARAVGEER